MNKLSGNDFTACPTSDENPWIKYPLDTWAPLIHDEKTISYKKNQILYQQDEILNHVYIIKEGRVRLGYYNNEGEEKSIFIAGSGCLFGEAAALPAYLTYYTATAATNCEVYVVSKAKLEDCIRKNPDFAINIIHLMARKMRIYSAQEAELTSAEIYERVCSILVHLVEAYGIPYQSGIQIRMKFTHQELANIVHSSRVTVTNILNILTKRNILSKTNGYYVVNDLDALNMEAAKK